MENINLKNVKIPEIKVDKVPFREIGENTAKTMQTANKIGLVSALSSYKMKTVLGKTLPEEDMPQVVKLVSDMHNNGWLTEADMEWCESNNIKFH